MAWLPTYSILAARVTCTLPGGVPPLDRFRVVLMMLVSCCTPPRQEKQEKQQTT